MFAADFHAPSSWRAGGSSKSPSRMDAARVWRTVTYLHYWWTTRWIGVNCSAEDPIYMKQNHQYTTRQGVSEPFSSWIVQEILAPLCAPCGTWCYTFQTGVVNLVPASVSLYPIMETPCAIGEDLRKKGSICQTTTICYRCSLSQLSRFMLMVNTGKRV